MSNENNEIGELTKFECFKCVGLLIAGGFLFFYIGICTDFFEKYFGRKEGMII